MTREERLDLLKQIEKDIYVCSIESTFLDDAKSCAIHSAIEELEQEPCEDCIRREKAKQFLYERLNRLNNDELYDIFSRIIDDMYNELPSVTPRLFINKPCVSEGVCGEDKIQVLGKIKEEIKDNTYFINETTEKEGIDFETVEKIIDKYKTESEEDDE